MNGQSVVNNVENVHIVDAVPTAEFHEVISITQRKPRCDGVYIHGLVEGIESTFTVDTGATRTLVSSDLYYRIPEGKRPVVTNDTASRTIRTADGKALSHQGTAEFELKMGDLQWRLPLIVADIADELLLGSDVLQRDVSGPADLLLSKGVMRFRGSQIPLLQVCGGKLQDPSAVRACREVIVPPMSEMDIEVKLTPGMVTIYIRRCT